MPVIAHFGFKAEITFGFQHLQDYLSDGPEDKDYNLIPRMVANTVLPIACDAAEFDWDPSSRGSTKKVRLRVFDLLTMAVFVLIY